MSGDWFYSDREKKFGPCTAQEVLAQIRESGVENILVWKNGFDGWESPLDVAEFASELTQELPPIPPPLPTSGGSVAEKTSKSAGSVPAVEQNPEQHEASIVDSIDQEKTVSTLHPWRRYFARTLDVFFFCMLLILLFAAVGVPSFFEDSNDILLNLLLLAAYVPFEAFCMTAFGTTLGKTLYKISVKPASGSNRTFANYLSRAVQVWFRGLGIGIPFVVLVTQIFAYRNLRDKGQTSWDRDGGWTVSHGTLSGGRWLLIIASYLGFITVMMALIAAESAAF